MKTIIKIISRITEEMEDTKFIEKHKLTKGAFTRTRKISFIDVVLFVLTLAKTTMPFEIKRYFEGIGRAKVVESSVTRARAKLSFKAFRELLDITEKIIPVKERFRKYRILAVDGMQGEMPRTPEILKTYEPSEGSRVPKFHAVAIYDVLNKTFLDAEFLPAPTNERDALIRLIEAREFDKEDVITADRGFPSVRLLQEMNSRKINYVLRVSRSFLKEVNDFATSSETDSIITVNYSTRRAATSRVHCDAPFTMVFRAVKIFLSSGETEILLTSLFDLTNEELSKLYFLRWNIETSYNYLKNGVNVENFVSKLENSILQEFYATLLLYNINTLLCDETEEILYKKP